MNGRFMHLARWQQTFRNAIGWSLVVGLLGVADQWWPIAGGPGVDGPAWAGGGKFNAQVQIGDAGPEFGPLPGGDGQQHAFADFAEAKYLVIVFTSCESPCATNYETRLAEFDAQYRPQGVRLVAISVSRHRAGYMEKIAQRCQQKKLDFPYLWDESQGIGQAYGAFITPQVFVLDEKRTIRYMGRIDDTPDDPDHVERPYLRQAIEALLQGNEPPVSETLPVGCRIRYGR